MVSVLRFIRTLYPVILIVAAAYRYGVDKYGDGTWQNHPPSEHIDKAMGNIDHWRNGQAGDDPVLVDACLRLMFAVSLAITDGLLPSSYSKGNTDESGS